MPAVVAAARCSHPFRLRCFAMFRQFWTTGCHRLLDQLDVSVQSLV